MESQYGNAAGSPENLGGTGPRTGINRDDHTHTQRDPRTFSRQKKRDLKRNQGMPLSPDRRPVP
nr:hypothetical protein [Bacillaceae bacterium]